MFGKLMKYELKSLSKGLVPLYGAILAVALINQFMFWMNGTMQMDMDVPQMTAIMVYTALCVAVAVMTLVIIVQRFYKGLLGQEGYLMFTLPVPTWQLTCSKLLGATIMTIVSGIVGLLSVMILGANDINWADFFLEAGTVFSDLGINHVAMGAEVALAGLASTLASVTQIYLAIALGHLANKHRVAMAFVWYIAINVAQSILAGFFTMGSQSMVNGMVEFFLNTMIASPSTGVHTMMAIGIASSLVQAVIFYFGTNYILKNKLNLE